MSTSDFTQWSITDLHDHMRDKKISPVEVVEKIVEKAIKKNKQINAFITIMHEQALQQAKEAEKDMMLGNYKGPLHGVPLGIKDLIDLKDTPTTCASELRINKVSNEDAEIVKRLKSKGAIILGKENMHSLAYGSTGDVSYFGAVKNPLDNNRISGGSSSGSAAAVASDLSYGSIGSDTGGSIRIPAACCGVVGMKPTFGSVSRYGTVSLAPTLDTLGPLTKTVQDNALMLEAIADHYSRDPFSTHYTGDYDLDFIHQKCANKVIGVPNSYYFDIMDNEIKELFDQTIAALTAIGFEVKSIDIPYMEEIDAALSVIFATEVYESLENEIQVVPEKIDKEIRNRILEGLFVKAHEYINMFRMKHLAIETFRKVLQEVDVIMTPTLCAFPSHIGEREIDLNGKKTHIRKVYSRLVRASNLTGFPAISVPNGVSEKGLSSSIQLIGLPFHEKELYSFAYIIEQL